MGKSREIIQSFRDDLETFVDDSKVLFEMYRELPEDLEPRKDIIMARIAIYADNEDQVVKVGAEKPADSRESYGIDISVVRGYRNDNAVNSELVSLDLKDAIIDWIKQLDAHTTSDGAIESFGYESASGFTRRKRYITRTLRCSGQRNLNQQQRTQ